MAARVYDIYDLSSAFVEPTTPAAAPAAPTTSATARMMRGGAYLLTLAAALLVASVVVALTPLGRIDADITVPFVAALIGALAAIAWRVTR